MTPASATAIGRTLSRLGRLQPAAAQDAPPTREAVFAAIAERGGPATIEYLCQQTGLHPNTVRPHLDVLLATGRITREQGQSEGRGRPPWLYSAVESEHERQRSHLARELARQLQDADSPGLAQDAAARWAGQSGERTADSIDDAVAQTGESLRGLGFEVSITPVGDRIDLGNCPYADLVAERPVICDIHAALLQQLLDGSGQPVHLHRLDVWSRPGVCTAHLRRTDQHPARTITMRSPE